MAAPIPLDAPVTTATLPDNLFFVLIVCDFFEQYRPSSPKDTRAAQNRPIESFLLLCLFGIVGHLNEIRASAVFSDGEGKLFLD